MHMVLNNKLEYIENIRVLCCFTILALNLSLKIDVINTIYNLVVIHMSLC